MNKEIRHWEAIEYMSSILPPAWNRDMGPGKRERHPDVRQLKIIGLSDNRTESLAVQQQGLCEESYAYPIAILGLA